MTAAKEKTKRGSDMPETIRVTWNGTDYELGFDRRSAMLTEQMYDVSMRDVADMHLSALMGLYYGSFLKRHPKMRQEVKEAMFAAIGDKLGLLTQLAEMYSAQVETLLAEPDEGNAVSWTAV